MTRSDRDVSLFLPGFVTSRQGYLSSRANALAFRRDPDYPLLLSLEHYDEEEETATKADIFLKRTVTRVEEPARADAPDEALALSMQWRGRVDTDYMARLLHADAQPSSATWRIAVWSTRTPRAIGTRPPTPTCPAT